MSKSLSETGTDEGIRGSTSLTSKSPEVDDLKTQKPAVDAREEDAGDGTKASDQILHGAPLFLCGLSLLLCMFLVALDQTIIATLLSTVGNKFGDFGKISWISSGFLLPTAVLAMSWGKISVVFGRKYTMLVSIVLFELGSLICAVANSMNMLIGGRAIAGVGGGGIQVMVFVILTEIVTLEKRGVAQGLVGMAFGVASVVAPLVGGAFTDHVSWRWCFYINLPVGGIAFACILFLFNPPRPVGGLKEKLLKIDYLGTVLLAAGLTLILLALTLGSISTPWNSATVISFFVVGGSLLVVFLFYNFKLSRNPLVPASVATVRAVFFDCCAFLTLFGAFMSSVLYLATYFQVVRNADAMHSGIDLLPMIIPVVICSIGIGITISKTGYTKPFMLVGSATCSIGFGLCTMLDENSSLGKRIGYLILPGVGIGFSMQSLTLNCQVAAPKQNGGVLIATSMIALFRSTGGAIGSAVGQTIQSVVFRTQLEKHRDILPPNLDLVQLVNSPEAIRQLPAPAQKVVIQAFTSAFQRVMYFSMALALATFAFELFASNKRIEMSKNKPQPPADEESKLQDVDQKVEA